MDVVPTKISVHLRKRKRPNVPVILCDIAPILHSPPAGPRADTILRRIPDALTPDDILEIQRRAVVHYPFRDLATGISGSLLLD